MTDRQVMNAKNISGFQVFPPEEWHRVPLDDEQESRVWAVALAAELTIDPIAVESLSTTLALLRDRFLRTLDDGVTCAAYIPHPELGQVSCALGFAITPLEVVGSADDFLESLVEEPERRVPGTRFRANRTWRGQVDAGELVASESLIERSDLASDERHIEARAVFGVFPPGANQMVQFLFSTDDLGAFDDMGERTGELVATLQVELEDAR